MKIFRKYQITGEHEVLLNVLANLKKNISTPFSFDSTDTKEYAMGIMKDTAEVAVFRTRRRSLFESKVYLYISNDKLVVANILSSMMASLGKDRYNQVIEAFALATEDCLDGNVKATLSSSEYIMEQHLSQKAYIALENWVETCPKNSPFDHPLDEERWFKFILLAKSENDIPTAAELGRWLREDKGWPIGFDEEVEEVEEKYSYSIRLLKYYDLQNKL